MRKIRYRAARGLIAAAAGFGLPVPAQGQDAAPLYPPYYAPSQSSVYNQTSVYLPTPPVAHGQDMVRGANGVSCQTAVGSGGPYLDVGLIGSQDVFNRDTAALYGRVVVPLGKRPKRPDCTKLYEMEISRMRMEIDLLRMGLPAALGGIAPAAADETVEAPAGAPITIEPRRQASLARKDEKPDDGIGDGLRTIFRLVPGSGSAASDIGAKLQ